MSDVEQNYILKPSTKGGESGLAYRSKNISLTHKMWAYVDKKAMNIILTIQKKRFRCQH